jgi:hypothetical protein
MVIDFLHAHPGLSFEPLGRQAPVTPIARGQRGFFPAEQDGLVGVCECGEVLDDALGVQRFKDAEVHEE